MAANQEQLFGYLTTRDLEVLTNTTRSQLDRYTKKGIVSPARASEMPHSNRLWAFDEAWTIRKLDILKSANMSLDDIAHLTAKGSDELDRELETLCMQNLRESRRALKSIAQKHRHKRDISRIGNDERNPYLRYIPQRWMALIPTSPQETSADEENRNNLYAALLSISDAVGWCAGEEYGGILSMSSDERQKSAYAFINLASPPAPSLDQMGAIDGGCYREICGMPAGGIVPTIDGEYIECVKYDKKRCHICALYGGHLSKAAQFEWGIIPPTSAQTPDIPTHGKAQEQEQAHSTTDRATSQAISSAMSQTESEEPMEANFVADWFAEPVTKPCFVLSDMNLPCGITACALPAGVYLCCQSDEDKTEAARERLMGLVSLIDKHDISDAENDVYIADEQMLKALTSDELIEVIPEMKEPFPDPEATPQVIGNPALEGWFCKIDQSVLSNIVLPTNTGLGTENGYCTIVESMPFGASPTRCETQILMSTKKAPPPARPRIKRT